MPDKKKQPDHSPSDAASASRFGSYPLGAPSNLTRADYYDGMPEFDELVPNPKEEAKSSS